MLRLLLLLVIFFSIQIYYFLRIIKPVLKNCFPGNYHLFRNLLLLVHNLYPVGFLLLGLLSYIFDFSLVQFYYYNSINYFVTYPFWAVTILMFQIIVLTIPYDITELIFRLKNKENFLRKHRIKILTTLILFFAIYIPARFIYDRTIIDIENYNYLAGLKNPVKLVLIADIQVDKYTNEARLADFTQKVNNLNPDIVLIAGDVITSGNDFIKKSGELIGKIKAKQGVYACVGDHDNWAYRNDMPRSLREVIASLGANNIPMIDNENRLFNINGNKIGVSFITDNYVERIGKLTLDGLLRQNKGDVKILLTHQPNHSMVDAAKRNKFNLMLAGHTHGGQVSLFFPFFPLSPTIFETKYVRGEFNFGNLSVIVNRGLGLSLAPVRYNSAPEISVITIQ